MTIPETGNATEGRGKDSEAHGTNGGETGKVCGEPDKTGAGQEELSAGHGEAGGETGKTSEGQDKLGGACLQKTTKPGGKQQTETCIDEADPNFLVLSQLKR